MFIDLLLPLDEPYITLIIQEAFVRQHYPQILCVSSKSLLGMLGNVVISKKFLRTRKIMVMHSNERGECCPRTLVD